MDPNEVNQNGQGNQGDPGSEANANPANGSGIMDLLNLGEGASTGNENIPDKFGEVETPAFLSALSEATNGQVTDLSSLNNLLVLPNEMSKTKGVYGDLKREYEALKAADPFANPLSKSINTIVANGGDMDTVMKHVQLQMQINKMENGEVSNVDKVKIFYQHKHPNLNDVEIEHLMKKHLGDYSPAEGDPDPLATAELKTKALEAEKFFAESKIEIGEPNHVLEARQQQQKVLNLSQNWAPIVKHEIGLSSDLTYSIGEGESKIDFNVKIPKEVLSAVEQSAQAYVVGRSMNGKLSLEPSHYKEVGRNEVRQYIENTIFFRYGKEIIADVIKQSVAEANLNNVRKYAGFDIPDGGGQNRVGGQQGGSYDALRKQMSSPAN